MRFIRRFSYYRRICSACIICGLFSHFAVSEESFTQPGCTPQVSHQHPQKVGEIVINSQDIFDESEQETGFIHRLANRLHITTEADVIAERLPFKEGQDVTPEQLAEAERIIRREMYIRDARVTYIDTCNIDDMARIQVETWDNWSLLPSLSFGRKGGKNRFEIGFKEDNLLGRGIHTSVEYKSDDQRSGYRFVVRAPVSFIRHSNLVLDVEDNDDGSIVQLQFDKPFYQLASERRYLANYLNFKRDDEIFQNGATRSVFRHNGHQYDLAYGFLLQRKDDALHRLTVGVTDQLDKFSVPAAPIENQLTPRLPDDRQFVYPWVEYQFLQNDFKVLQDIYLTNQNEDINLGWAGRVKIGYETHSPASSLGLHLQSSVSRGFLWGVNLLLLGAEVSSTMGVLDEDYLTGSLHGEYFNRLNSKFAFYTSGLLSTSSHPFADLPVTLGGESGVRGFPLQYQHGNNRAMTSVELRYYPQINIYRVLDMGMVAFFDAGKAWAGESSRDNEYSGVLASTGLGARFYSNRSSHRNVIHVDMAFPLSNGDNVDSWQWRLQVKQSF